jgi:predicted esterase
MTTLIVLHGFTQNGTQLGSHLAPLLTRLPASLTVRTPDAPHPCSEAGLKRLASMLGSDGWPAPHLCWWDATDDGSVYRGFEQSRDLIAGLVHEAPGPVGLLGFSQGAILTAALGALSARGEFPALQFVAMVAGRKPRAAALAPLFDAPLLLPSLHVWGSRDAFSAHVQTLVECFAPAQREEVCWDGPHLVPTYGPGADAIVDFLTRQAKRPT